MFLLEQEEIDAIDATAVACQTFREVSEVTEGDFESPQIQEIPLSIFC
jgi:hypothetical protein